ncbi:MAG: ribonuclease III family protein, partial [Burkholderiales bacterium]
LQLVITECLLEQFPNEPEGHLAKRRAALVCGTMLATIARQIKLGDYIDMSFSEISHQGRDNETNLEDCLEAVIGALYQDGGIDVVRYFVKHYWLQHIYTMKHPPKDAKSTLQEWVQSQAKPLPLYQLI